MFQLGPDLWKPQADGISRAIPLLEEKRVVVLQGPTGCGKTRMSIELFRWAIHKQIGANFYVNRKLLIGQTAARFDSLGLKYGIRAADYPDYFDGFAPIQITSADTEASRVFDKKIWDLADAGLVVVDEAHLQKTQVMRKILDEYKRRGAMICLLSATPVEMKDWADELVISGTMKQYRDCGALVPALVKTISVPDLSKIKRNQTGEYIMDGKVRKQYTQHIVGDVVDMWKKFNPDARPTMMYAPGKPESVWLTQQFEKIGVRWCHIDATDAYLDGVSYKLTRKAWEEISEQYVKGEIKGLSCRFKLREGIDFPCTYHLILATPIGSLASAIQTVGRGMRADPKNPAKDHCLITDHGGYRHNHGSPNHDQPWEQLWKMNERAASNLHKDRRKEGEEKEGIVCPNCFTERNKGPKCPSCGFEHPKSVRRVMMEDGKFITKEGDLVRPTPRTKRHDTEKVWRKMFFSWKKYHPDKSFLQLEGWFYRKHGYKPPRNLPLMPIRNIDWRLKISDLKMEELHGWKQGANG
jgi:superfamily II DNA or RNA helicase